MKAYGRKRIDGVEFPDKADALEFGLPSRVQKMKSKNRRAVRRAQHKASRRVGKVWEGE